VEDKAVSPNGEVMNTALKPMYEWKTLPWRKLERQVFKLQKRIYRASQRGDVRTVHRLQRLLMKSWSAKCLAVRRVTQDNRGKNTAGVDGVKSLSPKQRLELIATLHLSQSAQPTRRVWIPKPGKQSQRPLGIPTIADRALQTLVKQALEPEWEAKFEASSYGFRPGRSCHDAIQAIYKAIWQKPKYVLDADIAKCFDRINHEALLNKLNTSPTMRRQIRAWLKAGVMDGETLFPTDAGTPQGGCISPLLANIALDGMESHLQQQFPHRQTLVDGKKLHRQCPKIVRYADDFVILHEDLHIIEQCQQSIASWLQEFGLELSQEKTRITHTRYAHNGNIGFEFLGFSIQQVSKGNNRSCRNGSGKRLGFFTLITPSRNSRKQHAQQLKHIIRTHKSAAQANLIGLLNPVIKGWANYYARVTSKRIFTNADQILIQQLFAWVKYRHPLQGIRSVVQKYWKTVGNSRWVFMAVTGEKNVYLLDHAKTPVVRHIKVQGTRSPFDGDWLYWSTRLGRHPEVSPRVAKLLKRQKGKCAHCGLFLQMGDKWEIDHIIPLSKAGKDRDHNWQLLHQHCHDEKTAHDWATGGMSDNHRVIEEPCEVKVSCTVLKPSGGGDPIA
jgi:RNA-directed DNA polymerase